MANHPYNQHREQQVAHRRVATILKSHPAGAQKHNSGQAFSKITSKSAASSDDEIRGAKSNNRFARGGKVKGGNTTVNIVVPGGGAKPPMPPPMAGPMGPPPGGPPPMPPPPMGGPPGGPPGLPMRASGGRIGDTGKMIKKSAARAKANSSFAKGGGVMTAGSMSGEGRLQEAAFAKKNRK